MLPQAPDWRERYSGLPGYREEGDDFAAVLCPVHNDHRPSARLNLRTGFCQCYACNQTWSPVEFAALAGLPELEADGGREPATEYPYLNPDGSRHSRVTRFPGKKFRQARWTGTDWEWKAPKTRIPFRADRLSAADPADPVLWVEGERDVLTAEALGFLATTSPGGASAAGKLDRAILAQVAAGRRFVVVPDNDEPGRKYAATVAGLLTQAGAAEVRLLDLAKVWSSGPAPKGGDLSDWIAAGGRSEDLRRMALAAPQAAPEPSDDLQDPPAPGSAGRRPRGAVTRRLSTVTCRPVRFLWADRIPVGKISIIAGRPGLGKSLLALELAAAVTRGRPVRPGEEPCLAGGVVLLAGEDALDDVVAPRLREAGANLDKIVAVDGIAGPRGQRGFSLAEDLCELEAVVDADLGGDCRLLIVDPPSQFLGRPGQVDSHRDSDVRGILGPLAALAERRDLAVLLVSHHRKSAGPVADMAVSGSLAFAAQARAIWHVVPDPTDRLQRLLLPGKSNLGPQVAGLRFRVDGAGAAPRIAWLGTVDQHADDIMTEGNPVGRPAAQRISAEDWLSERLAAGPVQQAVLAEDASRAGIADRTLRRAKEAIGARSWRPGTTGPWFWTSGLLATYVDGQNSDHMARRNPGFIVDGQYSLLGPCGEDTPPGDSDPLQDLQVAGELLL